MDIVKGALGNALLDSLDREVSEEVQEKLRVVFHDLGQVLYEAGDEMEYIYFPTTAIISLVYETAEGKTAEIGVVGNEGMLGLACVLHGGSRTNRALIQSSGEGYRMSASDLMMLCEKKPQFNLASLRYAQGFLTQVSQTAVCNKLHNIDQQLARWLLLTSDRVMVTSLNMTHEMISHMIGIRREGVTLALKRIAATGAIRTQRGVIHIIDRPALEAVSCECYEVVRNEFQRLLNLPNTKRPLNRR